MRYLLLILLVCFGLKSAAQVEVTTVGTDFWFGFMQNGDEFIPTLSVFISSQDLASGVVEMPLTGWSVPFVTTPGVTTTIEVPVTAEHLTSGVLENKGIHIESDAPVSVYCINYANLSSDGSRILPTQFLDIEYTVSGYIGLGVGFSTEYMSELLIVATEDDTELEITPSCDMLGGAQAGVTFTLNMDQGESYQLQAADTDFDITGTLIEATEESGECRPFAVFGGSECSNIPEGCGACDHVFDQALPSKVWGTEYLTVPLQGSNNYTYRVLAINDGTNVSIDGVPTYVLNAGEYVEVNFEPNALFISANQPISVIQYMEGFSCSGFGDPAMLTLNATNQTMDEVTFATVVSTIIVNHNLNIVVESTASGSVFLDGVLIAPAEFTQFPGNPAFSYAQLAINQGSHTIQCDERFVAYAYGTGGAESYAYSTGAKALEPLGPVNVNCSDDQVILQSEENYTSAWWSTEANPEDTVFVGQPFIIDPPIPNEVYILNGNAFLSGCSVEESFYVESPEELVVNIVEDVVELCLYQQYTFSPEVTPASNNYVYSWTNANSFAVANEENGVIAPFEDGYYYLEVSTLFECSIGSDSVFVDIIGDDVTFFDAVTDEDTYCAGDTVFLEAQTGVNIARDLFSTAPDPALWADLQGNVLDNVCGSMSGNALYFDGGAARYAETNDFDMTDGGLLSFAVQISDGSGACDGAEFGENVIVEYSTDGGGAWAELQVLFEGVYPTFTQLDLELPAGAQSPATRFRWIQPVFSAATEDVWMLDNISVNSFAPSGFQYTWTSVEPVDDAAAQSTFVVPTQSAWYYVSMSSAGCSVGDSINVMINLPEAVEITGDTLCAGETILLDNSASGFTYLWSTTETTEDIVIGAGGLYSVNVIDSAGCVISADILIEEMPLPVFEIIGDNDLCIGESSEFTADIVDVTYLWNNAVTNQSQTLDLVGPQIVWAEVTDTMGCVYRDSIDVIWRTPPALLIESAGSICEDTGTVITAVAEMVSYLWETSATTDTIFVTDEGYYSVVITDQFDCVTEDSIFIERIDFPLEQALDTFFCEGGVVVIFPEVFPGFDVSWSTGSPSDSLIVGVEGNYQMVLTNDNCIKKYTLFVANEANPELELSREGFFCEFDSYAGLGYPIFAESDGLVEWPDGSNTDTVYQVYEEGIYWAISYSELGCTTTDSIFVPNVCLPNIFAPSAFTPDDDGVNDHWQVVVTGQLDEFELRVFDRWGDEIFKTNDPDQHWNGSVRGGDYYADDDVYHYVIKYEVWENVPELISGKYVGTVTLIR